MMNILISLILFVLESSALSIQYNQMPPPKLECGSDGIRLSIDPAGTFGGHVYVRGFFPQSVCHLNYCTELTRSPITMDLPFRGPCNIRRRRNVTPPSISYDVTVIIQHHPLFITSFDKAYRLNCIYRHQESIVQQKLNVSDIPDVALHSKNVAPNCRYDVVSGTLNGPIVRFANVGDIVVHKWTCDGDQFGFVVHSCVVRDESGNDYQFVDERGCVSDSTLFNEITYSNDLQSAFTAIRAFRYADQLMVHFSCQITTCRKNEQGCEGISPPVCHPIDLGPVPVYYTKKKKLNEFGNDGTAEITPPARADILPTRSPYPSLITTSRLITTTESTPLSTTTNQPITKAKDQIRNENTSNNNGYSFPNVEPAAGNGQDNQGSVGTKLGRNDEHDSKIIDQYGLEIDRDGKRSLPLVGEPENLPKRDDGFHVETLSKTMEDVALEPFPFPTKATVYQHRQPRSHRGIAEEQNITLEVETAKLLILEKEEDFKQSEIETTRSRSEKFLCTSFSGTVIIVTLLVSQTISLLALITQRIYHKKSINKLIYSNDRQSTIKY